MQFKGVINNAVDGEIKFNHNLDRLKYLMIEIFQKSVEFNIGVYGIR